MQLLMNDLSVHEQFLTTEDLRKALAKVTKMRGLARESGYEIRHNRCFLNANPLPGLPLFVAVSQFSREEQRALKAWLTSTNLCWDHQRRHTPDDYFECDDQIVTGSALAEAAYITLEGHKCGLISISPSDWTHSPIKVAFHSGSTSEDVLEVDLDNWWQVINFKTSIEEHKPPIRNWHELSQLCQARFVNLSFLNKCFDPLFDVPFSATAVDRIISRLTILNRLSASFDKAGVHTPEGHTLYQDHFTGDNAYFSDSSTSEKNQYRNQLSFVNPDNPQQTLICSWHGKIRHSCLRLHFSWPVTANKPVYVAYIGPKLTKR